MTSNLPVTNQFISAFNDLRTYLSGPSPIAVDNTALVAILQNIFEAVNLPSNELNGDLRSECYALVTDLAEKHQSKSVIDETIYNIAKSILSKLLPKLPNEILRHGIIHHLLNREGYISFVRMGMTAKEQKQLASELSNQADLSELGLDTKEKRLNFIISQKLKTADLRSFEDITAKDLKRLSSEHPRLENLFIKTSGIPCDLLLLRLKTFPWLKSFENSQQQFKYREDIKKIDKELPLLLRRVFQKIEPKVPLEQI